MPVTLDERDDRIVLCDGPHVLGTLRWQRNRVHDQPGVLLLNIDGFTTIPADELPTRVNQAVQALLDRMREGLQRHGEPVLTEIYWTLYGRSARHDAATPERLTASERLELSLGDPQLDRDASVVAERAGRPVGLCTAYRTDDPTHYELGILGVDLADNSSRRRLTQQALAAAVQNLRYRNATRLQAEIDSDDPHTLYALAEWPFKHQAQAVTLTLIPYWK